MTRIIEWMIEVDMFPKIYVSNYIDSIFKGEDMYFLLGCLHENDTR